MKNIFIVVSFVIAMIALFMVVVYMSFGWMAVFSFFAALTLAFMGIGEESKVWRRANTISVCFFLVVTIFCGLRYIQII